MTNVHVSTQLTIGTSEHSFKFQVYDFVGGQMAGEQMAWEANGWEDFGRRQTTRGQKAGGKQLSATHYNIF